MDCWLLLRFFQLARLSARQVPCKDSAHTVEQDRNVISLHAWVKGCFKADVRTANLCVHVVLPYFIHLCVDLCVVISGLIKRIKCLTRIHMHFHVLIRAMACQEWHVITFFIFSNLKWSAASCIPIWNFFLWVYLISQFFSNWSRKLLVGIAHGRCLAPWLVYYSLRFDFSDTSFLLYI